LSDITAALRAEHERILMVLECFENALATVRDGGDMPSTELLPFVEFFRDFADGCHHRKEEENLFVMLARRGFPRDAGPIAVMLEEHEIGRRHVQALSAALEGSDTPEADILLAEGTAYIDLLRSHIDKENGVLFDIADDAVGPEDAAELAALYRDVEADEDYARAYHRGMTIADQLAKAWRGQATDGNHAALHG